MTENILAWGLPYKGKFKIAIRILPMPPRLVSLTALALLSASVARADVILDTYTGFTNDGSGGYGLTNGPVSTVTQSFLLPASYAFVTPTVTLDLGGVTSDAGSLIVTISTDANTGAAPTAPGTVLQSVSVLDSSLSAGLNPFSFSASALSSISSANGEYWVTVDFATSTSSALINANNANAPGIGLAGQLTNSFPPIGNIATATSGGAFEMIVDTPEPASIAVLGAAMAGLGYVRRRRSATKA